MLTYGLICMVAVVVLYVRFAQRRLPRSIRKLELRNCMFLPDIWTAVIMIGSGLLFVYGDDGGQPEGWPAWRVRSFQFVTPIWTGWCMGVIVTWVIAGRRGRRSEAVRR